MYQVIGGKIMSENILGTEKISKLFLKFTLPAVISMVLIGIQTIIDGMFLGNYVGKEALASINIVQPYMQVIMGISFIIAIGSLSIIGRYLGEGKKEAAQNTFKTAFVLSLLISSFLAFVGITYGDGISLLLGSNEVLRESVSSYITTISIFVPFMSCLFLFGFIDRLMGRPDLFLKASILSVIVNVSLDFVLIKHLELGIRGAAFATGLAFASALIMVLKPVLSKKSDVNIFAGKFSKEIIKPMLCNGSSEGVSSVATAISVYVFNMTFMNISGVAGVAAFTAISYLAQFGTMLMFGISDGIGAILSYNYGNKNQKRLNETLNLAYKFNSIIAITMFLILFTFGKELVSLFANGNEDVLNLAVSGSKLYAFAFLLSWFNIIKTGYFTAIGNATASIILAASRGLIFIIIGINVLPVYMGIQGVWLTVPFAEASTLLIGLYLSKKMYRTDRLMADAV